MLLDFDPLLLFNVVLDVESYPEFLPWCSEVSVILKEPNWIKAKTVISFGGVEHTYVSKISFQPPKCLNPGFVKVTSTEGVFKNLYSLWEFLPSGKSCHVKFYIEYEFKSKMLQFLLNLVYKRAQTKLISAFKQRVEFIASKSSPS